MNIGRSLRAASVAVLSAVCAHAAQPLWFNHLGDARNAFGTYRFNYVTNCAFPGTIDVKLPEGEYNSVTFTMWARFMTTNDSQMLRRATMAHWIPEIRRTAPDITEGAFGYPGGTNLDAAVSIPYTFTRHEGEYPDAVFPRGCYTIAGWCSNTITVTMGGKEITFPPGEFNKNAEPGEADDIIVSGGGLASVGISKMYPHEMFSVHGGVFDDGEMLFNSESVVTNELIFLAYRILLNQTSHVYRADLYHFDWDDQPGITNELKMPDDTTVRILSSKGLYRFGFTGHGSLDEEWELEIFDPRLHTRWIRDDELERIYQNGMEEIERRGVPRWKYK